MIGYRCSSDNAATLSGRGSLTKTETLSVWPRTLVERPAEPAVNATSVSQARAVLIEIAPSTKPVRLYGYVRDTSTEPRAIATYVVPTSYLRTFPWTLIHGEASPKFSAPQLISILW